MERAIIVWVGILLCISCSGSDGDSNDTTKPVVAPPFGGVMAGSASPASPPSTSGASGTGMTALPIGGANAPVVPQAGAPAIPMGGSPAMMGAGSGATPPPTMGFPPVSGAEPALPKAPEPCQELKTGTMMILGTTVNVWVGAKSESQKGPIYISWHGTGGNGAGAMASLGAFGAEILAAGGVIAAPNETTMMGVDTGNAEWFTGDFGIADQIVACAVEQLNIDTRRIWTGGHSAGGLQAGAMVYWRSSYLASAIPSSGGVTPRGGVGVWQGDRVAPTMTMHGAMGMDVVVIDFSVASMNLCKAVVAKGGFAVDCDHGGGHGGGPPELRTAASDFLKAHPFGVMPEPYAGGLPATFPSFCTIIR